MALPVAFALFSFTAKPLPSVSLSIPNATFFSASVAYSCLSASVLMPVAAMDAILAWLLAICAAISACFAAATTLAHSASALASSMVFCCAIVVWPSALALSMSALMPFSTALAADWIASAWSPAALAFCSAACALASNAVLRSSCFGRLLVTACDSALIPRMAFCTATSKSLCARAARTVASCSAAWAVVSLAFASVYAAKLPRPCTYNSPIREKSACALLAARAASSCLRLASSNIPA